MKLVSYIALTASVLISSASFAESPIQNKNDATAIVQKLDYQLFELGFNQCQLEQLAELLHQDLDFYHDIGGTQNKSEFMVAMAKNICPKTGAKPIRKLVAGTTEVFKLKKDGKLYGIIQRADHEFYRKESGKPLYKTGKAKFTHVWVIVDGQWKLKESLSFEHRAASDS